MKQFFKNLWKDESAQGTAEYVLLIAVVVGIIMMFKEKISSVLRGKIDEISGKMGEIN